MTNAPTSEWASSGTKVRKLALTTKNSRQNRTERDANKHSAGHNRACEIDSFMISSSLKNKAVLSIPSVIVVVEARVFGRSKTQSALAALVVSSGAIVATEN